MIGRYLSAIFPMGLFESLQILDDNGVDLIVFRKMDELEAWAFVWKSFKAQPTQLDRPLCIPAAFDLVLVTPFLTWNQADISLRFCPRSTNNQSSTFNSAPYCQIAHTISLYPFSANWRCAQVLTTSASSPSSSPSVPGGFSTATTQLLRVTTHLKPFRELTANLHHGVNPRRL